MNTRAVAANVLEAVLADGKSLTAALEGILPTLPVEQDRAFVQALSFGVARWYFRLDFILRQLAPKPIRDEQIRLLALLGLYQLEYMRVKPHAAVGETVEAAGRKAWAKPLLNGVLRSFQRERERLLALADADPSAAASHPAWLTGKLRKNWPQDYVALMEQANLPPPLSLRVNSQLVSRESYLDELTQAGISAQPSQFAASCVVLETPMAVERLPGFAQGRVSVQDEAAQLAAGLLDLKPGQRVLDVCAAPGGKTLHILENCPGLAELVAVDIVPERLKKIAANLARAGLAANLQSGDAAHPQSWWDGKPFDRILLDAPCSATGVVRRHPDIKLLRQPEDIERLAHLQQRILDAVWPLLAEGGLLVYATCSVFKQENETQIVDFLCRHPDARELPITANWGRPGLAGQQILTGEGGMDGFYYACIAK